MREEINSKHNRGAHYEGNYFVRIIALNAEIGEVKAICVCVENECGLF